MSEKVYGYTKSGEPINDEMIEHFVEEADKGYDVGQLKDLRRGRGRPPLGDAAKVVGSLRLDPVLRKEAELRADSEGVSVSELLRRALQDYLKAAKFSDVHRQHLIIPDTGTMRRSDGASPPRRFASTQRRLFFEIESGFTTAKSEFAQWLIQFSGVYRDLSDEFKKVMEVELASSRESAEKIVHRVQTKSTDQMVRMKAFLEEAEKLLRHLDDVGNSKSSRRR